ncbi:transcription factor bHLH100 isoform X2 [Setaria italica]|uniref:transcription factor bHLH100 isoform X2 n=1 Tax=Setaria italica TaxID=4555 RepID=UPI000BE5D53E|nr:transcription factor bHLH100 isoform X2 [Setaria italica]
MDQQVFDGDPFVRSISPPEEDTFSGQLPWPDFDFDDVLYELSKPAANETSSGGSSSQRKRNHNAYERDRRKHLNELYSSLHSLLPDADHAKKPSIAITVARVLKYIPELQKQVENLEVRKKKLMNANCKQGALNPSGSIAPIVSVNCLNEMEIMVQISFLSNSAEATLPFSVFIEVLENEGLRLISSSTFSPTENRTFYSLHLQAPCSRLTYSVAGCEMCCLFNGVLCILTLLELHSQLMVMLISPK